MLDCPIRINMFTPIIIWIVIGFLYFNWKYLNNKDGIRSFEAFEVFLCGPSVWIEFIFLYYLEGPYNKD